MHLKILLFTSVFASGALSKCTWQGNQCEWFGTALSCDSTDAQLGDTKDGWTLEDWTKELSIAKICDPGYGTLYGDCCDDYGAGCWTGYKRLWCKE